MKKNYRLGVIGGGFMAHAILEGALKAGFLKAAEIAVSDPDEARVQSLRARGVFTTTENQLVAQNSEYLLLAVKPQTFPAVAEELQSCQAKIITIMAGVKKQAIRTSLRAEKVARAMPNLPCSVGEGMIGLDSSDFSAEEAQFATNLFQSTGKVVEVKEELLNAVTGVSGSGPAYVYLFIKSLVEAGVKQGFTQEQAYTLALQTVKGGVTMVENTPDKSLSELISAVSSKGGTTVAALEQFHADGWAESVSRAVDAAVRRAEELSK